MQIDCVPSDHRRERCEFLESGEDMQGVNVRVDEAIWASSILPEGIVERWFIADGAIAEAGEKVAEIRVEGAVHEITSPARGRVTIVAAVNNVVEPGSLLATLAIAPIDTNAGD